MKMARHTTCQPVRVSKRGLVNQRLKLTEYDVSGSKLCNHLVYFCTVFLCELLPARFGGWPVLQARMIPHGCTPLLVLVNVKSGGQQGMDLIHSFRKLLNPHQVYDLMNGGPLPGSVAQHQPHSNT